jgi:C1A family cysteine protease
MKNWADNLEIVNAHNKEAAAGLRPYALKMNKFADMTKEEYKATMLGLKPSSIVGSKKILSSKLGDAPASWDWRPQGVVNPIKNQARCGSCWAFSAIAAMEGAFNIKNKGSMPSACTSTCGPDNTKCCSFSEQELVDCTDNGTDTCNHGGSPTEGVLEIADKMSGKANTEEQYPYTSGGGKSLGVCHAKPDSAVQTGITDTASAEEGDEDGVKKLAHESVVSIGIDASHNSFQLYSHGVYVEPECSTTQLDHGVSIVGYGSFAGPSPGPSPAPTPTPTPPAPTPTPGPSPGPSPAPGPWDCIENKDETKCEMENGCHWCTSIGGWCSNSPCDNSALTATGSDSGDYWIVRNSWGTSWGLDGYIYMARNKDNQCGVATNAVIAKIGSSDRTSEVIV